MTIAGRRVTLEVLVSLAKPQTDLSTVGRVRPDARVPEHDGAAVGLPTQDDLPCSDGQPLDTERHGKAIHLLSDCLAPWLRRGYRDSQHEKAGKADRNVGGYVAGNMFLYYALDEARKPRFVGPDVMVMLGVEPVERKSWVVWQENDKGPDVVIELLSETSKKIDKEKKPWLYRDEVGVRE